MERQPASYTTVYVLAFLVAAWWLYQTHWPATESFELASVMSLPPDPAYADATPLTLIQLYKGNNAKMAEDLRSLGLPDSYIGDPKNYPAILSALKRLRLLPT